MLGQVLASYIPKNSSVQEGHEVFIYEEENGWFKIRSDEKWVSKKDLKVD